ncbi:MAG: TIGR02757 family protein [Bacteroidia bacterium]
MAKEYNQTAKCNLKKFLDKHLKIYNHINFISNDPICIPHRFIQKQDIEIAGFFAAILAWGLRKTIINKCTDLLNRMDNEPYLFVLNATDNDLKKLIGFKHRTFNDNDLLYFINFLNEFYKTHTTLEDAFVLGLKPTDQTIEKGLNNFRKLFFSLPHVPNRTKKHIASPEQKSACKRLNMYLRWMVRKDNSGVDFGLWTKIKPQQLVCPLDVHSGTVARKLNLLTRKQNDWQAAVELTENLKKFSNTDPVKYDLVLFGLGEEKLI